LAKTTMDTGVDDQPVHSRTTADTAKSQVAVLGIDGSDGVVPAHAADGLSVKDTTGIAAAVADVETAVAALASALADPATETTLAAVLTALADPATESTLASVLSAVDGLEGGIGAAADAAATQGSTGSLSAKLRLLTSQLNTLIGHVDGLEGFTDGVEGSLTTLIGHVDGVETALTTLDGRVDGLEALLGSGKTLAFAEIDRASSGEVVAAQGAGNRIYVVSYAMVTDGAVTAEWRTAATGISGAMSLAANSGVSAIGSLQAPLMRTAANEALNLQLGAAVGVRGHLTYYVGT
jgi:hypothetical protein